MFPFFLKGLMIGFAIAAPVGPIGILCIQRTLRDGFKAGLMAGTGAALADGAYGLIAGFGLTAISSLLIAQQFWIHVLGGSFLIYLGIKLLLSTPVTYANTNHPKRSPWHACATTFLLTLTNPTTILSFAAVFAGLGLGSINSDYDYAIILVLGITLGSALWWLILSTILAFVLKQRMSPLLMQITHWISASILLAFGIFALQIF